MTTYAKLTVTVYQDTAESVPQALLDQLFATAEQMKLDGKTDAIYSFPNINTVHRDWVDQAAAEAWVNYIVPLHASYNVELTSVSIIDNPNS